jgi:nucleoside phosphorylase
VQQQEISIGKIGKARIGILTVIIEEFEELRAILGTTVNVPGSPYYVARIEASSRFDVVLMKLSGRGNIVSATGTRDLLEDFKPDYVLLVGIAGGIKGRDDTYLADVVVADFVEGYEMQKLSAGQSKRRKEPHDHPGHRLRNSIAQPIAISGTWLTRVQRNRCPETDSNPPKVIFGNLIFGEKILGDDEDAYQQKILQDFDNADAVDMESGGVARSIYEARVTKHYNPQYLVIRGISDYVDAPSNNEMRRRWKRYAAHVAAVFASRVADTIIELD